MTSVVIEKRRDSTYNSVSLDGGSDLLGPWRHVEGYLGLETVLQRLLSDCSAARHVFVAGVGAAADQSDTDVHGPARFLGVLSQLGDRVGQVRGEGAVDVRLQG